MALAIQQNIRWLQISVHKLSRVQLFQRLQNLLHYLLLVNFLQYIGTDDSVQVCFHLVEDKLDVSVIFSPHYIQQPDYIFVSVQILQKHYFPECSLSICSVLKSVKYLFKSYYLFRWPLDCFPDNTLCSFS